MMINSEALSTVHKALDKVYLAKPWRDAWKTNLQVEFDYP